MKRGYSSPGLNSPSSAHSAPFAMATFILPSYPGNAPAVLTLIPSTPVLHKPTLEMVHGSLFLALNFPLKPLHSVSCLG